MWIGLVSVGLILFVSGDISLITAWTMPTVDVGGIIAGLLFLFGLGLVGVGLPFLIGGLVLRFRPPPARWGGLNEPA
jgi:hypothetical protein